MAFIFNMVFVKQSQDCSVPRKIHGRKILHFKLLHYINIFSMFGGQNRVAELAALNLRFSLCF